MNTIFSPLILFLVPALASAGGLSDPSKLNRLSNFSKYFKFKPSRIVIREVKENHTDSQVSLLSDSLQQEEEAPPYSEFEVNELMSTKGLMNWGKMAWTLISTNQPVFNQSTDFASALPVEAKSWQELGRWQAPRTYTYHVYIQNLLYLTVVDFYYTISFTPGGTYEDRGAYLNNVSVIVNQVSIGWAYTVQVSTRISNITNAGTREHPIAAMELHLNLDIGTKLKQHHQTMAYYIRGDGVFNDLSKRLNQ